ncbi:MAG: DUF1552 domain-containing protein [Sandaracinaceae bacterium]|nr:DUF1552 domain-containing protein [Sandaracinaceae bacterium]
MSGTLGRRDVIRGLGVGAAALGLGLGHTSARGQATRPPKRVIFFYGGSGSRPGLWEPQGGETDWALNDLHRPLAAHRDRLTYVGNLHMMSAETDRVAPANAHIDGGTHAMTAAHRVTADRAGAPSIDQAIVRAMEARGDVTAVPSLEVQAADWPHAEGSPVYSGPNAPLPFLWDPREVYARLFPDGRPDPSSMDQRPEQRSRVLDFALGRFGRLDDPRLAREARDKLGAHADQLRSIQRRLSLGRDRAFNIPERSTILSGLPSFRWDTPPETKAMYWQITTETHTELVVSALHADVTRVVTFYCHDAPGPLCPYGGGYYRDGDFGTSDIHDLTHKVNDPRDRLASDPNAREVIRQQHLRTTEVLARLLDRLAETIEPDGSSLLDHTLVVFVSQIADGSHSLRQLPWFVAGDCQGAIRTGRWLSSSARRGHGALYRTVARALDLDLGGFGADGTGLIDGLLA